MIGEVLRLRGRGRVNPREFSPRAYSRLMASLDELQAEFDALETSISEPCS